MSPEVVVIIAIQFVGFAYLFGQVSARVKGLERDMQVMAQTVNTLANDFSVHIGEHEGAKK